MRPTRATRLVWAVVLLGAVSGWTPAGGWLIGGHRSITLDAVAALPDSVPGFFRAGAVAIAEASIDPDVHRPRSLAQLRDGETPEHYLDLELLEGRPIPATRSEHLSLVAWLAAEPGGGRVRGISSVGTLPYSVTEGLQRLTVAFAEHRKWPDDVNVQAKIKVYAGLLAHYAADLCQPLHTTLDHDGRAREDGSSPHTGIHRWVDGLPTEIDLDREAIVEATRLRVLEEGIADVVAELLASHGRVDPVYELSRDGAAMEDIELPVALVELITERYGSSVRFVGSLFLTAWETSEDLVLPDWLQRSSTR